MQVDLNYRRVHIYEGTLSDITAPNISNIVSILGMTIFVQPFSLFAVVSRDMEYTGALCYIHGYLFTVFIVTIQLSLLMISLDRNYAIMNSLRYPYIFTQSLCNVLIALSWLFGIILAIPPLASAGLGRYRFQEYQYICSLDWTTSHAYLGIFSSVTFLIPVLIQGGCYLKIFMAALGHSKRSRRVYPWVTQSSSKFQDGSSESADSMDSGTSSTGSVKTTECKAVRTIFLIALAYCICWVPYFTDAYLLLKTQQSRSSLRAAAICLIFTTSVLNPVIYAYMNRITRREIGRFLCGNPVQSETEDFASTSLSTFTTSKQAATGWVLQQRHRSRSTGGIISNEMDTIPEETEETKSEGSYPITETTAHSSLPNTNISALPYTTNCLQNSDMPNTDSVHMELKHLPKCELIENDVENIQVSESKINDGVKLKLGAKGESLWSIVKTEKFFEERRRATRSNSSDAAMPKYKKRKRRDCGSFLYFQNDNHVKSKLKSIKRGQSHSEVSVDHRISVAELPDLLKFRLSVTDVDKSKKSLTLNSKFEIKNKSFDGDFSQCGASTSRDTVSSSNVMADIQLENHDRRNRWHRSKSFAIPKWTEDPEKTKL